MLYEWAIYPSMSRGKDIAEVSGEIELSDRPQTGEYIETEEGTFKIIKVIHRAGKTPLLECAYN